MPDLFGEEVVLIGKPSLKGVKRVTGYAAPPGTGPAGETCGTCRHIRRERNYSGNKRWAKCAIGYQSSCDASDIKVRAPACKLWESPPNGNGDA